jgi:hypothetical protein
MLAKTTVRISINVMKTVLFYLIYSDYVLLIFIFFMFTFMTTRISQY